MLCSPAGIVEKQQFIQVCLKITARYHWICRKCICELEFHCVEAEGFHVIITITENPLIKRTVICSDVFHDKWQDHSVLRQLPPC